MPYTFVDETSVSEEPATSIFKAEDWGNRFPQKGDSDDDGRRCR
jgi:hypothetical protein